MSKQNNLSEMIASIQAFQKTMPAEAIREFAQYSRSLYTENDTPTLADASEELAKITANSPKNNPAKWEYDRLVDFIKEFEAALNDEQEIGLQVFPHSGTTGYYVREIECWSPYIIAFHCFTQDGRRATLIQHHSQLNFLLTVLPKHNPQLPARRIGFRVHSGDSSDEAE